MSCQRCIAGAFIALLVGMGSSACRAAPILDLYNTGVNSSGVTLGNLAVDPHYVVTVSPIGAGSSFIVNPGGFPIPPWVANTPGAGGSMWISGPGTLITQPNGEYLYQTTFTIGAGFDPATALITGQLTADDRVSVDLNSVPVVGLTPDQGYGAFTPFSINSNFISGVNTLTFHVFNTHSSVTGLRVEMSGTVQPAAVPEPATALLAGLGLLGAVLHVRRRRRLAA